MSVAPSGMQDVRQVDFAAPSGLNVVVIGKDNETGLEFQNAVTPNIIIRMMAVIASGLQYDISIVRDGKVVRTVQSPFVDPALPGPVWTPFPWELIAGQFQIQAAQTKGAAAALTLYVVYDHPLGQ